jgi:hypothetical protein
VNNRETIGGAAVIAGVGGFTSYWLVSALIEMSCSSRYNFDYSDKISTASTSFLASLAIAISIFVFSFVVIERKIADKFDKVITLFLATALVFWLAFVFVDGNVCSAVAWRSYVAYLIVPSLLATIALIGKRWLKPND